MDAIAVVTGDGVGGRFDIYVDGEGEGVDLARGRGHGYFNSIDRSIQIKLP